MKYGKQMGFGMYKMNSKQGDDGNVRWLTFVCARQGISKSKAANIIKPRQTEKIGCMARINATMNSEYGYTLSWTHAPTFSTTSSTATDYFGDGQTDSFSQDTPDQVCTTNYYGIGPTAPSSQYIPDQVYTTVALHIRPIAPSMNSYLWRWHIFLWR